MDKVQVRQLPLRNKLLVIILMDKVMEEELLLLMDKVAPLDMDKVILKLLLKLLLKLNMVLELDRVTLRQLPEQPLKQELDKVN